ncbi:ATP-binding protein [Novosphingobium mangrovi (ex Huang et al. 2023)]|uniref:ATP-binding protein n=1 Tax=Novosphingobium mangrovi (ex Huang et al. 2023) TaxID=2976432 RepID=A0ABT2IAE2_9SPHN|nr:ATP-binding protein [Novosphingobium mangrovi (ex Huang et al. 2023)]MCT2401533.1 ATP-binding protein [Novosphingobium mangrovi (ex Huang et al. 2023)]
MNCDYERTLSDGRAGFPAFLEAIESYLEGAGLPIDVVTKVMIVFDELGSNILDHGSADGIPSITTRLNVRKDALEVELSDTGIPFDPLSLPAPDTSLSVEDRPVGGLGIHIVRELMDRVEYNREGALNTIRFAKKFSLD